MLLKSKPLPEYDKTIHQSLRKNMRILTILKQWVSVVKGAFPGQFTARKIYCLKKLFCILVGMLIEYNFFQQEVQIVRYQSVSQILFILNDHYGWKDISFYFPNRSIIL